MSAIIGVCAVNFCTLVADRRLSYYGRDGIVVASEDFQKIFKVNENFAFGSTGLLEDFESVLSPLEPLKDRIESITIEDAKDAIVSYLEKSKFVVVRTYILVGRNKDGKFCVYEIFLEDSRKINCVYKEPKDKEFSTTCALPPDAMPYQGEVLNAIGNAIKSNRETAGLIKDLAGIICRIADIDKSVNKRCDVVDIH